MTPDTENGWIEWAGGVCPVDGDTLVNTRWSDDDRKMETLAKRASLFRWSHAQGPVWPNLIAYRVVQS